MSKHLSLLFLISTLFFPAFAQKSLTNSRTGSHYTYIYTIDEDLVKALYSGKHPDQKQFKNPVDSFLTGRSYLGKLPAGNYLKVNAENNQLKYSLLEERSAILKPIHNGRDLQFILVDTKGNELTNAEVSVNGKKIKYDPIAHLWRSKYPRTEDNLIRVYYNGVANYSTLEHQAEGVRNTNFKRWLLWKSPLKYAYRPLRKYYYQIKRGDFLSSNFGEKVKRNISGYLVFNKPIYKLGDTVRFKAYLLQGKSHKTVKGELELRLQGYNVQNKVLGTIKPTYKGSYNYAFPLHDSLKLKLDYNYTIGLYRNKKLYREGRFKFEEYELKSISFKMRADKKEHRGKEAEALFFKATDENGLNVLDGRVDLSIKTQHVSDFIKDNTFVPDTLWKHHFNLDPLGETKITLPDSIFPQANIRYKIFAEFLNSNNEKRSASETIDYHFEAHDDIKIEAKQDSLHISSVNHKDKREARINLLDGNSDTIKVIRMQIPALLKMDPMVAEYEVETDSDFAYLELKDISPELEATSVCKADSVYISVSNPRKIPFWYTILDGKKVIERGNAVNLNMSRKWHSKQMGYFRYGYIWGGKSLSNSIAFSFADKELLLDVKQPLAISPGEQTELEVVVKDPKGKAVRDVDITAYSITSKFNYSVPEIPYFGRRYRPLKERNKLDADEGRSSSVLLNWQKWGKEIGLDSIEYYRFTHPQETYRYTQNVADKITQVAPFIVNKGDILPVHILYIDNKPVFFEQAEQLERYSFKVEPGLVRLKFRLYDKIVDAGSVIVPGGKKLVVSFDLDSLVKKKGAVMPATPVLSEGESANLNNYIISVTDTYSPRFATIKSPDQVYLLRFNEYNRNNAKLVGPFSYNRAVFQAKGTEEVPFLIEPGYDYTIRQGLIKQKSISSKYPFKTNLANSSAPSYRDYVLSNSETDSLWADYLDLQCHSNHLFHNTDYPNSNGALSIKLKREPRESLPLVKSILLYRNDSPDFLNIYAGKQTELGNLEKGTYRLMLLLKGDSYILRENIFIRENGRTLLELNFENVCPKDAMSMAIASLIRDKAIGVQNLNEPETDKIKEIFNQQFLDVAKFTERMSGRILDKADKEPVVGASLKIKGTSVGVSTDIKGRFNLRVPSKGKLVISYIGYKIKEVDISPSSNEDIYLEEANNQLNEVVVVGYSSITEQSLQGRLAGVSTNRSYMTGSVSRITIRGTSSLNSNNLPLYVIDGIPVETGLSGLSPDEIGDITTLKDQAATAIWGARAASGVVIVTTKKAKEKAAKDASAAMAMGRSSQIRKNFSDYAFWQPALRTDSEGKARFKVTFPDDITNWKTFLIAMNGKEQSGYKESQIRAYKPLSATFVSPQFALKGDSFSPLGKISNYSTDAASVVREFTYNGKVVLNGLLNVKNSYIDTLPVLAEGQDSLSFRYSIKKASGYNDGEERKIPLFNVGVVETKGQFNSLEGDTSVQMTFEQKSGKVNFRAEASLLPVILDETEKLHQYQYLCNEQTASKLKALLIRKKVKTYLKEPFEYDRNVKSLIKKLDESRRDNNSWGWWKSSEAELWISRHVLEAFVDASEAGYEIPLNKQEMIDYLVYQLSRTSGIDKLDALLMLEKLNAKVDLKAPVARYQQELKLFKKRPSLYEDFKLLYLKQKAGEQINIDSLMKYKHSTMFGNLYFGEDNQRFFDNSIQVTLLAYKIIRSAGNHPHLLSKMRNYFFEQRKEGEWRNTYESSLILETLLPDILKEGKLPKASSIQLSGAINAKVDQFPFTASFESGQKLGVKNIGGLPVYITAYQQFWNASPEKITKDFKVDTWFEDTKGAQLTQLKGGLGVTLKARVSVKADADFVMVEIPIPAGCSYDEKRQGWWGVEAHREYFKNKVSIFCRKLKEGVYTFEVKLMPRYDGVFNLNPAKAEMMYFPVFFGREEMKKVKVGNSL